MNALWLTILLILALATILPMRGGAFHEHLAQRAAAVFESHGLTVRFEHPLVLPGGGTNFVDLWVTGRGLELIVEVETTPRYALTNLIKAQALGQPLWFVVPTRAVRQAIATRLRKHHPKGPPIDHRLLLPDEVGPTLTHTLAPPEAQPRNQPPEPPEVTPRSPLPSR